MLRNQYYVTSSITRETEAQIIKPRLEGPRRIRNTRFLLWFEFRGYTVLRQLITDGQRRSVRMWLLKARDCEGTGAEEYSRQQFRTQLPGSKAWQHDYRHQASAQPYESRP